MLKYFVAYAVTATVFLLVDLVWLGFAARAFYRTNIGALLADQINVTAAVIFYLLYIAGIVIFAISPALESGSWRTSLIMGSLFGFFAYATYDMTNLATLRDWPVAVAVVDMAWGAFLTGLSATAGFFAAKYVM
jgi:uncharacterized membrane protein